MMNLLNLSVPPNVLLPVPAAAAAAAAAAALPPVLVLALFVFFTACAFFCGDSALLFFC
jgi:hypothetical protein